MFVVAVHVSGSMLLLLPRPAISLVVVEGVMMTQQVIIMVDCNDLVCTNMICILLLFQALCCCCRPPLFP
jgi:hypothetical protein